MTRPTTRPTTLPDLFARQVARTPDAPAVRCGTRTLSYAELDAHANRLAHRLIGLGVGPERVVGVSLPRSAELVVALLAVLKAGGAYVPIDQDAPADRVAFIIEDTGLDLVIGGDSGIAVDLGATGGAAHDPEVPLRADNLAYVIYTSGSTGRPKGVAVQHDTLARYLDFAVGAYPGLAGGALLHSPVAFDLTVTALYGPLISGGCVRVAALDREPTAAEAGAERPAFVKATPSHLPMLTALPAALSPTTDLVVGGEMLVGDVVDRWRRTHPGAAVVNEYGPTEATVGCCVYRIGPDDVIEPGATPIGVPTPGTSLYVLDERLAAAPAGTAGELYIAGGQLARGYLGRAGLTSARFVADPFGGPGERMYRTGDIARWRPDGNLEYLGRTDDQVKIRGYRIELGEVTSVVGGRDGVRQAAVVARADATGDKRLVAYVVPSDGIELDTAALRESVATVLPAYMVPSAFVVVDELPLTTNGKLDQAALPEPRVEVGETGAAPSTPEEAALCAMFAEILGVGPVSADDDFFERGGDSLRAARLANLARKSGWTFGLRDVLELRTPRGLGEHAPQDERVREGAVS